MGQVVDVLSDVTTNDVLDTGDVARVLGASRRSIARWQAAEVSPRRPTEERLLELKAVVDLARQHLRPDVARPDRRRHAPTSRVLVDDDVTIPRHIGETAHQFGYQAVRNASAAGVDDVIAVLVQNLRTGVLTPSVEARWNSLDDLPLL